MEQWEDSASRDTGLSPFDKEMDKLVEWHEREIVRNIRVYDSAMTCLLYTSPSPRDRQKSRMPSSA